MFDSRQACLGDVVWMFGDRSFRQTLEIVDVLFPNEGSAHKYPRSRPGISPRERNNFCVVAFVFKRGVQYSADGLVRLVSTVDSAGLIFAKKGRLESK
jgi:hypothetical protein